MSDSVMAGAAPSHLVPAHTTVETSGHHAAVELGPLAGRTLLLILRVEETLEQESLHVSIWGSPDGKDWGAQALFWFPQKFYSGASPAALDLGQRTEVKFLQARWELNRWGRGIPRSRFTFGVEVQEASA